ncbi:hypothetical protein GCM10022286_00760 [Gryllotalpicola daejeonensis]|uniref:Uncharacterized protein n=1 Tax=Gryllotalpicola daejeonensis TaxID=993087 RepID=A0ABP7ZCZ7_9MICO
MKLAHRLTAFAVALTIAVGGAILGAGAADAATVGGHEVAASVVVAAPVAKATGDVDTDTCAKGDSSCTIWDQLSVDLPLNRWSGATDQLHSRLSGNILTNSVAQLGQVVRSAAMAIGNWAYKIAGDLVQMATVFNPLDVLGFQIDARIISPIGQLITTSTATTASVISVLVMLVVATSLWETRKTQKFPWKRFFGLATLLAVIFTMVTASASEAAEDAGKASEGVYSADKKPVFLSPWWVIQKTEQTVAIAGSLPSVAAQSTTVASTIKEVAAPGSACSTEMTQLAANYDNGYASVAGTDAINAGAIPQAVSELWVVGGLQAYENAQFGDAREGTKADGTPYSSEVFCQLLDRQSGIAPVDTAMAWAGYDISKVGIGPKYKVNIDSAAWNFDASDPDAVDQAAVAWAACIVDPKTDSVTGIRPAWKVVADLNDCKSWWSKDGLAANDSDSSDTLKPFDIPGNKVDKNFPAPTTSSPTKAEVAAATDFVNALHGNAGSASGAGFASAGYAIGGLATLAGLGAISLATCLMKLMSVLSMIALFFILVKSILARDSGAQQISTFAKKAVGGMIMAWATTFVLSLIVVFAQMMSGFGRSLFTSGSPMLELWNGFSPLLGLVCLSFLLKSMGMPGIFKVSEAMAWGGAASTVGGSLLAAGAGHARGHEANAAAAGRRVAKAGAKAAGQGAAKGAQAAGSTIAAGAGAAWNAFRNRRRGEMPPAPKPKPKDVPVPKPGPAPTPQPKPAPTEAGTRGKDGVFAFGPALKPGERHYGTGAWIMGPGTSGATAIVQESPARRLAANPRHTALGLPLAKGAAKPGWRQPVSLPARSAREPLAEAKPLGNIRTTGQVLAAAGLAGKTLGAASTAPRPKLTAAAAQRLAQHAMRPTPRTAPKVAPSAQPKTPTQATGTQGATQSSARQPTQAPTQRTVTPAQQAMPQQRQVQRAPGRAVQAPAAKPQPKPNQGTAVAGRVNPTAQRPAQAARPADPNGGQR